MTHAKTQKQTLLPVLWAQSKSVSRRVVLHSAAWRKHLNPCCQTQGGGHWPNQNSSAKKLHPAGARRAQAWLRWMVRLKQTPPLLTAVWMLSLSSKQGHKTLSEQKAAPSVAKQFQDSGKISGKGSFSSQKCLLNTLQSNCLVSHCSDFQPFFVFSLVVLRCAPQHMEKANADASIPGGPRGKELGR